jgi:hypothetical protein
VLTGLRLRCRSWGLQLVWFDREINYIDLKQAAKKRKKKKQQKKQSESKFTKYKYCYTMAIIKATLKICA